MLLDIITLVNSGDGSGLCLRTVKNSFGTEPHRWSVSSVS